MNRQCNKTFEKQKMKLISSFNWSKQKKSFNIEVTIKIYNNRVYGHSTFNLQISMKFYDE